jgi:hypothetical protein
MHIYKYQKSNKDCFPTCFLNALQHFSVPINDSIRNRFSAFDNGTENCTVEAATLGLDIWEPSIQKLIREWYTARKIFDGVFSNKKPAPWAKYLYDQNISIEFCRALDETKANISPESNKNLIMEHFTKKGIIISEIFLPPTNDSVPFTRHAVLLLKVTSDTIHIHDPLEINAKIVQGEDGPVKYCNNVFGPNLFIDTDYFFSPGNSRFKPFWQPTKTVNKTGSTSFLIAISKSLRD